MEVCNDSLDMLAMSAWKDPDSEGGFGPVGSTATIHNCMTVSWEFHGGYTANPRVDFH